jgi:hypothetical protein
MNKKTILGLAALLLAGCYTACNNNGGKKPTIEEGKPRKTGCDNTQPAFSSDIPHEVEVNLLAGYSGLVVEDQVCFDYFSWRSFVALNWPANPDGSPMKGNFTDNPDAPRVWESYTDPAELFGSGEHLLAFGGPIKKVPGLKGLRMISKISGESDVNLPADIEQATGQPLIDKNLNYALYEIMVNPDETKYIRDSSLNYASGQVGKTINFPAGYYDSATTGGQVGAIEIKATWKILVPGVDDSTKFYRRRAVIYVPASNSATGKPLYLTETVGLVAMHILHKTQEFPMWIWTTFEHNSNAPDSAALAKGAGNNYSFYNAAATGVTANTPPQQPWLWQASKPYASGSAYQGKYGTQVVQSLPIADYTQAANKKWQAALGNSVWANYRLIASQWGVRFGDNPTVPADTVGVPALTSNPVLETYFQQSSCLTSCHKFAKDAVGNFADFSFLLQRAKKLTASQPK